MALLADISILPQREQRWNRELGHLTQPTSNRQVKIAVFFFEKVDLPSVTYPDGRDMEST